MDTINEISIDGFKVVSADYFTSITKPSSPTLTVWDGRIGFTKQDILMLNSCDSILIQVHSEEKKILVVPTKSIDKDAIKWIKKNEPLEARKITCQKLTDKIYDIWGWDKDYIYRALGKLVTSNNKVMLLFDFENAEKWKRPEARNVD